MKRNRIMFAVTAALLGAGFLAQSDISVTSGFSVADDGARVFEVLGDFEAIPLWNSTVLESTLSAGPAGAGSEFTELRRAPFGSKEMEFRVLEYVPNSGIRAEGVSGKKRLAFEYEINETNEGTAVKLSFTERPVPLVLKPCLTLLYRMNIDANMIRLRNLIEGR